MPKGNSNADRLREAKEILEDIRECHPEWLTPRFRADTNPSPAVSKAAQYFNLDLTKKDDADLLLNILAGVVFPERGRDKGNKHWGVDRLVKLGKQWLEIARSSPGISDYDAAEKIKKQYPGQYQSEDTIRQRLPDARLLIQPSKDLGGKNNKTSSNRFQAQLARLDELSENYHRLTCIWLEEVRGSSRPRRREAMRKISKIQKSLGTMREVTASLKRERLELEQRTKNKIARS
jgi:hypothetical protein